MAERTPMQTSTMRSENPGTRQLVLIVEDDVDAREAYDRFLSMNGFRTAVASDGREALRKVASLQPDIVVMDLAMPTLNGKETIQALRDSKTTARIPVLVLTAHARDGSETVRTMDCEGFLIKPCAPSELLAEVNRVLQRAKK
jgi:DNA-binding response OmpR family regulator